MIHKRLQMEISLTREMFYFKVPQRKPENIKKRIVMPKIMKNLVVLMEPSKDAYYISSKADNMCLNRFCIDEDAAFELSGVHYLEKSFRFYSENKGKGYSS